MADRPIVMPPEPLSLSPYPHSLRRTPRIATTSAGRGRKISRGATATGCSSALHSAVRGADRFFRTGLMCSLTLGVDGRYPQRRFSFMMAGKHSLSENTHCTAILVQFHARRMAKRRAQGDRTAGQPLKKRCRKGRVPLRIRDDRTAAVDKNFGSSTHCNSHDSPSWASSRSDSRNSLSSTRSNSLGTLVTRRPLSVGARARARVRVS
jgi:hypothetical protein